MQTYHTRRITDVNGWLEVRDNPLSKVGVFPYLGSEIGAEAPDRIYQVYRPAEELADPECIASFRLLPFVDEHEFLGAEGSGGMPAERKGVQGMIGEQVYFQDPYLLGNIKIVSEAAKGLIDAGKIELSPGYRCRYEFTPGVFEGQSYDAVQRHIRGNHLALVAEGRTGPDVAVQDHLTITIDSAELLPMEFTPEQIEQIRQLIAEALSAQLAGDQDPEGSNPESAPAADTDPEAADQDLTADNDTAADDEPAAEPAADEDPATEKAADKAVFKALDAISKRLAQLEKGSRGMDASLMTSIADRDALAAKLSGFVGTFDHSRMTAQAVAAYGVRKLGVPASKGSERIALDAYLHGRIPAHKNPTVALDASGVNLLDTWEK